MTNLLCWELNFRFAPLMPVWILQALVGMGGFLRGPQADRGRLRAADGMENFLEGGKIQAADFQGEMFLY